MRQATGHRWAAIDIGTNSVRLLVADVSGETPVPIARDLRLTRLGQGVDRARRLAPEAVERTLAAVGEFATRARAMGAAVVVAGTSALRDAADRDEFRRRAEREHGVSVAILSGPGEAALSFLGAVRGLPGGSAADVVAGPATGAFAVAGGRPMAPGASVWVVDVGGGSTEVVRGTAGGSLIARASADVGAVRMTELCVRSDPISGADWRALEAAVEERLAPLWERLGVDRQSAGSAASGAFDESKGHRLIGVGGTATTLAAMDQRLVPYDPDKVHGYRLTRAAVARMLDEMRASTVTQRCAWPGLQPQRADIILAGTAVVHAVMEGLGAGELIVSEADLLDGLVLWAARMGRDPAYLLDA